MTQLQSELLPALPDTLLKRLESDIEETENEISSAQGKLTDAPYEQLMGLTKQIDELSQKRDSLYEEWEEASAQLEELSEE